MPTSPTPLTATLFLILVAGTAVAVAAGFRRAGIGVGTIAVGLLGYLVVPAVLASQGALDRYSPLPAPALLLVLALTIATAAVVASPLGGRLAGRLGLGVVVVLQAFRIGVELLLHRLYLEGVVPVQMTYAGRNFDVVSGVTGLLLGVWLLRGRPVAGVVVLGWNVLGLGLLINIVTVAVLSTPVPFRVFTEGPPNLVPSTFPLVLLPSFLVQVAFGSHLLVFRQLGRRAAAGR